MNRLPPIGPRAKGGPALRLPTYANKLSFKAAFVIPTRSPPYFLGVSHVANENKSELRDLLTSLIIIIRSLNLKVVIAFLQCLA